MSLSARKILKTDAKGIVFVKIKKVLGRMKGITLFELIISLLILAILTSIAVPAMGSWLASSRSNAHRQQLQSFISLARSYALNASSVVTLCHLDASGECSLEFELPISQFVDSDRNARLGGDEEVLKVLEIDVPQNTELSWSRDGFLRFWPSGGTGALTGSLSYCNEFEKGNDFRIVIARTGRTRIDYEETRCE